MKIKKDEEIKTRVEPAMKSQLWQVALNRSIDLSDVVREALRDYLRKTQNTALSS
jgi:hypothetical protein